MKIYKYNEIENRRKKISEESCILFRAVDTKGNELSQWTSSFDNAWRDADVCADEYFIQETIVEIKESSIMTWDPAEEI